MSGYLECHKLSKAYGSTRALRDVDLSVGRGRVHAVVGENGAGKSTLGKVIAGLVPFDGGSMTLAGRPYRPASPRQAVAAGVGMVHQQPMLFPSLSVAENVVLGREPVRGLGFDRSRATAEVEAVAARYGVRIDPRAKVADLSPGERQRVAILQVLHSGAQLLIFDEPTAALAPQEASEVLHVVRRLVAEGHAVVLVAHKLDEVIAAADEITALRDGRNVFSGPASTLTEPELVKLLVGDGPTGDGQAFGSPGPVMLEVAGLHASNGSGRAVAPAAGSNAAPSVGRPAFRLGWRRAPRPAGRPAMRGVSFAVRAGEILGVVGVEGSGQEELELVLAGLVRPDAGTVRLAGDDVTLANPRERRLRGLVVVPSDRRAWACAPEASVFDNSVSQLQYEDPLGLMRPAALAGAVKRMFTEFDVRSPGLAVPLAALSGGNIQKLVLGRELTAGWRLARGEAIGDVAGAVPGGAPVAIVLGSPTRGIDVRGMRYLHALIRRYRDAGCAVLLVSTDLDEALALSDRIVVLAGGAVAATLPGAGATTKEELGRYMLGAVSTPS